MTWRVTFFDIYLRGSRASGCFGVPGNLAGAGVERLSASGEEYTCALRSLIVVSLQLPSIPSSGSQADWTV